MGLNALISDEKVGVMIPIPQYPLYSAAITLCGGRAVNYYLDERDQWSTSVDELQRALSEAQADGTQCRALAVINPGNPTGQVLSRPRMEDVLEFCSREGLVLLADEVYQENIWDQTQNFTSFKKILRDMEAEGRLAAGKTELMSFHSVSKGFFGECGRRGGYVEMSNIDPAVVDQLYKLASVSLCSNVDGQLMVGLMVNPPKPGDASYDRYNSEKQDILQSLQRRAQRIVDALNTLEGVTCNQSQGALYAFPQIELPQGAVDAAAAAGKAADAYYCLALLEATGIVVVPGSGFGQEDGTFHFRTTILPQEEDLGAVIERMTSFHA